MAPHAHDGVLGDRPVVSALTHFFTFTRGPPPIAHRRFFFTFTSHTEPTLAAPTHRHAGSSPTTRASVIGRHRFARAPLIAVAVITKVDGFRDIQSKSLRGEHDAKRL